MKTQRILAALSFVAALAVLALGSTRADKFIRWENASSGLEIGDGVKEITVGGTDKAATYAIGGDGNLYRSDDLGSTWSALKGNDAPLAKPYGVAAAPSPDGSTVFCGTRAAGGGLFRSTDGCKTWKKVGDKSKGMASDDVETLAFDAKDPKFVLVGHAAGKAVSVSVDGGDTWTTKDLGADMDQQIVLVLSGSHWVVASRSKAAIRATDDSGTTWSAASGDADYFAGNLPVISTGDNIVYSSRHHGMNKSVDGGKSFKFEMGNHTRVVGACGDYLFREERVGIRGANDRVFDLEVSTDFGVSWQGATFSLLAAVPAPLRSELVVSNEKDPFAHIRLANAWSALPSQRTVFLALGKAGLYRGTLMWTAKAPIVTGLKVSPLTVVEGDTKTKVTIQTIASARLGKLTKVVADLSVLGLPPVELASIGNPDDKTYGGSFTVPRKASVGDAFIGVWAEDADKHVGSDTVKLLIASVAERMIVWDGEKFAHGGSWCQPKTDLNYLKAQTDEVHNTKTALELHGEGAEYIGGGWNWHGWYPADAGTDVTSYANLSFWMKTQGDDPGAITCSLTCSSSKTGSVTVNPNEYAGEAPELRDGKWHEIVIPLKDLMLGKNEFDPRKVWEFDISAWAPLKRNFSIYVAEIGFDNRRIRSHGDLMIEPLERDLSQLKNPAPVTAEVDVAAAGTPISPYIYGASFGDRKVFKEAGLTIMRAGGNPVTPLNWKHGFSSKGADWFYVNDGAETAPENNWLVNFHKENKPFGLETYLTMPMMGRVAKDATSVAFDITKYPNQEKWAGKEQPTDPHKNAGNGRQAVMGPDGQPKKDDKGNVIYKDIEPDPNDTSVEMSPQEQTEMLRFMIDKMGYGTADKGGIKFIALDNEPGIWHATHRGMHPKGMSYDELWDRTEQYASLLKKIDPGVKIAGPTAWGWTEYLLSGLDAQECAAGRGSWDDAPDYKAHGRVWLSKWWMKKLNEYEKKNGVRLVDILDWHFYPQTNIYQAGKVNDPAVMEGRVQETRVLWDPQYKDPSWMGKETGNIIRLIPLMKEWIAECNPGMQTSLGEYNFGGEGDVSGGVAQAELFGIFAREQLDMAFLWGGPGTNSPQYFAFRMYRSPDGKNTAFGDRYLPSKVDAPTDVSVHAAKDSKTGRLSFVLVNKRAAKDAKVTLKLSKAVPDQDVAFYQYSAEDRYCIGLLPSRKAGGDKIEIDLPSLSVLRFDLKP